MHLVIVQEKDYEFVWNPCKLNLLKIYSSVVYPFYKNCSDNDYKKEGVILLKLKVY